MKGMTVREVIEALSLIPDHQKDDPCFVFDNHEGVCVKIMEVQLLPENDEDEREFPRIITY